MRQPWNSPSAAPIPAERGTALLLVHPQYGYRSLSSPSTPNLEQNISSLIAQFRKFTEVLPAGKRPAIFYSQHRAVWTDSPLHPDHTGPYGLDGSTKRGVDFLECATPRVFNVDENKFIYITNFDEKPLPTGSPETKLAEQDEVLMTSHGHSVFINVPLEQIFNQRGVKTLLIAGTPTDLSVSTAVRMAENLALTGKWGGRGNMDDVAREDIYTDGRGIYVDAKEEDKNEENGGYLVDMPRIILIDDATRAYGKGGIDGQTVHDVHIESLREFVEVRSTEEVLKALQSN